MKKIPVDVRRGAMPCLALLCCGLLACSDDDGPAVCDPVCSAGERCVGGVCVSGPADAGDAGRSEDVGLEDVGNPAIEPPRPIWPPSTSVLTSRRPEFRFELSAGSDGASLELCRDRACADPIETVDATGASAQPTAELPPGVVFWRFFGRAGGARGAVPSATWQATVGARSRGIDTAWGTVVDVNGDGFSDAVVGAPGSEKVYVHYGSSTGLEPVAATRLGDPDAAMNSGYGSRLKSAGDVDGDGFGDLLIGDSRKFHVYHGSSAGLGSTPRTTLLVGVEDSLLEGVAIAGDLDGDGYGDVVLGGDGFSALWFRGGPDGLANTPSATLALSDLTTIAVADVDGDRFPDVIVGIGSESGGDDGVRFISFSLRVFFGADVGPSEARSADLAVGTLEGAGFSAFRIGDFDGDGYADAVLAATSRGEIEAHMFVRFGGAGGFTAERAMSLMTTLTPSFSPRDFISVDATGDGYDDFFVGEVSSDPCAGHLRWWRGGASGLELVTDIIPAPADSASGCFGTALGRGDVDGDGISDLLVAAPGADASAGRVSLLLGGPTGPSPAPASIAGTDGLNGRFGAVIAR